jgi:diguanylate cyclase (GGDEF)-like protein
VAEDKSKVLAVSLWQAIAATWGDDLSDNVISFPGPSAAAPLFLLSALNRDDLAAAVSLGGWQAIAARRMDGAERRFVASGAMVAIVDARGDLIAGLKAVAMLADATEANGAALLALIDAKDAVDSAFSAGATHFLVAPFSDAELAQALRFAERHAVRLSGGVRAAVVHAELDKDSVLAWQGNIETGNCQVSEALRQQLALVHRDTTIAELFSLMPNEDRNGALSALRRLKLNGRATAFTHEMPSGDAGRVAHHLRMDPVTGLVQGTIELPGSFNDPFERGARDPLTGARSATALRRWLSTRLPRTGHNEAPLYVMLVAVTQFEMINAAFGREVGDSLLRAVARRIEPLVTDLAGRSAVIARIAGAEFAICIDRAVPKERVHLIAEQLVDVIERPFISGEQAVALGSRIGVVEALPEDEDATQLLRRASQALAEAKSLETGHIRMLIGDEADVAMFDASLHSDLRSALNKGEIDILFQPQVSVTTGKIVGVEALARWQHPVHGVLGAVTLFSVAEQSDYLVALSAHVQERAAVLAAAWPESLRDLRLSVNVTAADIAKPGFVENFLHMVESSGFPRDRLTVEITESGLMEDLPLAADLLASLRAAGCRVAIDDFGTGYSSLAYLKALPLDYLKIDKSLAEDITGTTRDRIVVRGVIDMARSLGLAVIAEGVETEEQLGLLAQEGCNYYQGYLCSEPLDVASLTALKIARDS